MDCDCERLNRAGARYCEECGAPLRRTCPRCKAALRPQAKFCDSCGAPVGLNVGSGSASAVPRDYTPKHLADKILQSRSALEGERKQVTVLFADVEGSMELANQLDAEEWHSVLDRFFQIMTEGVHRYEGSVNQYTGDGIMALFGAPIAHEDHGARACHAVLWLQDELDRYSRELEQDLGLGFSVRMGLNSGEVVVGKIGDDLRMDYTAQGHTVGLAARMQEIAASGACYITAHSAGLVSGLFELEDMGKSFDIKGVEGPLQVFKLVGASELRTRFEVARAGDLTRLVGRESELQILETALERARQGNGQVLGVVGEAGVGKSRLCYEFVELRRREGLRVYEGQAVAHGKNIPLLPMLQVFRDFYGIADQDPDEEIREKIAARLLSIDEELREALPFVFEFFGVPDPNSPAPRMDPDAIQRQLFGVLRQVIKGDSQEEVGIALLEDLHWIDGASEAFLEQWVQAVDGSRMLLLVNFRPEYHAEWMSKSYYLQLPLLPLGPQTTRGLLQNLLGTDASLAGLIETIYGRTRGNPFFTEEVAQSLIESGSLEGSQGAFRLTEPIDELGVPETVQAVLAARIDRLEALEKDILETAAVIGRKFPESILAAVTQRTENELERGLRALSRKEFIFEQSRFPLVEYAFKHPLTQEVALSSQLKERRRGTHAAVARAIAAASPQRLEEQAALLAHHWEEAGETLEAMRWYRRAAEWVATSDFAEAFKHWQRLRALTASCVTQPESDSEGPTNDPALEHGLRACETLLMSGWRLELPDDEIDRLFAEGKSLAHRVGDARALVQLYVGLSAARFMRGSLSLADEPAGRGLELAEEHGSVDLQVEALSIVHDVSLFSGQLDRALELSGQLLELADGNMCAGTGFMGFATPIWVIARRGWTYLEMGRPQDGLEALDEAYDLAVEHEQQEIVSWIYGLRAVRATYTGELGQVLELSKQAMELCEKVGSHSSQGSAHASMGRACLLAGDPVQAIAHLEPLVRDRQPGLILGLMMADLAMAYLFTGQPQLAISTIEEGVSFSRAEGFGIWEARCQWGKAQILRLAQGPEAAEAIEASLAEAEAIVDRTGARAHAPFIQEERARFAMLVSDPGDSQRDLERAHRLFLEVGASGHAQRVAYELKG